MILFEVRTAVGENAWKVHHTFLTIGEAETFQIHLLRRANKGTKGYIVAMEYPEDKDAEIREVWRGRELEA